MSTTDTATATTGEYTDEIWVEPWPDAVLAEHGHDARSEYVEQYWLSVLGPTTSWLLRLIAGRLAASPQGVVVDLETTARTLGLGYRQGRHSPITRAVDRLTQFGLARRDGFTLYVRCQVPPLSPAQLRRLPPALQAAHAEAARR